MPTPSRGHGTRHPAGMAAYQTRDNAVCRQTSSLITARNYCPYRAVPLKFGISLPRYCDIIDHWTSSHAMSPNVIQQCFAKLYGVPSWNVRQGYGSFLTFEFVHRAKRLSQSSTANRSTRVRAHPRMPSFMVIGIFGFIAADGASRRTGVPLRRSSRRGNPSRPRVEHSTGRLCRPSRFSRSAARACSRLMREASSPPHPSTTICLSNGCCIVRTVTCSLTALMVLSVTSEETGPLTNLARLTRPNYPLQPGCHAHGPAWAWSQWIAPRMSIIQTKDARLTETRIRVSERRDHPDEYNSQRFGCLCYLPATSKSGLISTLFVSQSTVTVVPSANVVRSLRN